MTRRKRPTLVSLADLDAVPFPDAPPDDLADEPSLDDTATAERGAGASIATRIVALVNARTGLELWHDPRGSGHVTFSQADRLRHVPIASRQFRRWVCQIFYREEGRVPGESALDSALAALDGAAAFDGHEHPIAVRVGGDDSAIWVDLADGRVVQITADGWRIVDAADCPIRHVQRQGMTALAEPRRGEPFEALWEVLNVPEPSRPLVAAFLVCALRPERPYPVLILDGEAGSGKSSTCRVLRVLIDPRDILIARAPRDDRDLATAVRSSHLLCFDNLSGIDRDLSDALCGIATGSGFEPRALYTDHEQISIRALAPILLNGISNPARESDLLDRAYVVSLPRIADEDRRTEQDVAAAIDRIVPGALGALYDAVACALRRLPEIRLRAWAYPRMADACEWAIAAAPALGFTDEAMHAALTGARDEQVRSATLEDPLGAAILAFVEGRPESWSGTATDLLAAIDEAAGHEGPKRPSGWPRDPRALSTAVNRLAPGLRLCGVHVERGKTPGPSSRKIMTLCAANARNLATHAAQLHGAPGSTAFTATRAATPEPNGATRPHARRDDAASQASPPASQASAKIGPGLADASQASQASHETRTLDARAPLDVRPVRP